MHMWKTPLMTVKAVMRGLLGFLTAPMFAGQSVCANCSALTSDQPSGRWVTLCRRCSIGRDAGII